MKNVVKEKRDRWITLAFACVVLLFVYGPAADWTIRADWFAYDQIARRMDTKPLENGTIISIDSANLDQGALLDRYKKVIYFLKQQQVGRIISTHGLPDGTQPDPANWLQDIGQGVPVYLPRSDALAKFATQSGFVDTHPDADGVLRKVALWQWTDGVMTPSLPLAIAVDNKKRNPDPLLDYMYLSKYKPVTRFTDQEILAPDFDASPLAGKTILLDQLNVSRADASKLPSGQLITNAGLTGSLLAALEQDQVIRAPLWSQVVEWLTPLLLTIIAVLVMPGAKRRHIGLIALATFFALFVFDVLLLLAWQTKLDVARAAIVFVLISTFSLGLASFGRNEAVNALKQGTALMAAGDLEKAFSYFRLCNPSEELSNSLYKLSLAFESAAKPERAEAVLNWIKKTQVVEPKGRNTARQSNGTPQQLGRYVIERKIGRGAMGAVYLARDPRINRAVALKVIPIEKEFEDEDLAEARLRFFGEAESAGRLTHPNIITVFDAGEDKHLAYIAMEFLRGTPLAEYTKKELLLPTRKVLELCATTAEALDYAHKQQVIHRDIKPANLLYDRKTDTLKISDFGVARLTDSKRTKTGIVLGTPMYMSPEQLNAETLTGHSDLFSLGVTLYELLTGEVPFKATNIAVLMTKITTSEPEPVSTIKHGLGADIDAVVKKAMAKKPKDRFASGMDMANALRECARFMRA